jgi:hypothetical protein
MPTSQFGTGGYRNSFKVRTRVSGVAIPIWREFTTAKQELDKEPSSVRTTPMTTEETVSVARGGRSTILSRDNAPANSPINAKGQHPPFFAHPGHGLSPFRPRSVSSKFEEVFFRVRSFPPSSRSASIWAPDPSISDEDEVRFIVSNGARDIIPMRRPNARQTRCRQIVARTR